MSIYVKKAVQHLNTEQIKRFSNLSPDQIILFLDEFRTQYGLRQIPKIPKHLESLHDPNFQGDHWSYRGKKVDGNTN